MPGDAAREGIPNEWRCTFIHQPGQHFSGGVQCAAIRVVQLARENRGNVLVDARNYCRGALKLGLAQNQDLELARGTYCRRYRLTREQRHLTECPAWSHAIHVVLDPVSVQDEHVGGAAAHDVQIARAVTFDKQGHTR